MPSGAGKVQVLRRGTDSSGNTTSAARSDTEDVGAGGVATWSYSSFADRCLHNHRGQFVPTDSTVYDPSTLDAGHCLHRATAAQNAPDPQTIDVSIPAGSLTITTPYGPKQPVPPGYGGAGPVRREVHRSARISASTRRPPRTMAA